MNFRFKMNLNIICSNLEYISKVTTVYENGPKSSIFTLKSVPWIDFVQF